MQGAPLPEPLPSPIFEPKVLSTNDAGTPDLGLQRLKDELEALPKVGNFQLRFEEHYKAQIKGVAERGKVTPETLLQGLWEVVQSRPGLIEEAIVKAKTHHERRERASELKITLTRATKALQKYWP